MADELTADGRIAYSHTQAGTVVRVAVSVPIAALLVVGMAGIWQVYALAGLFILVLMLFHSLTVQIDDVAIGLSFGVGLIRKSIPLDEVAMCQAVRNRWVYGFGIRYTFTGWMWNVSGLDAVELTYTNGKRFRIGTDEPQELAAAITQALKSSDGVVRRGYMGDAR